MEFELRACRPARRSLTYASTNHRVPAACRNGQAASTACAAFPVLSGGRTIVTCVSAGPTEIFVTAVGAAGNLSAPSNTDTFDCSL